MQYLEVDIFGVYFGLVKIITLQAHSRHVLLCRDMASRVALVMAPLLPGICMGVGNNGLKNGGVVKGGGEKSAPPRNRCHKQIS